MSSETSADQNQRGHQNVTTRPPPLTLTTSSSSSFSPRPQHLASSCQQVPPRDTTRGDVTGTNERVHTTTSISPMEDRLQGGYTTDVLPPPDTTLLTQHENLGVYSVEAGGAVASSTELSTVVVIDEESGAGIVSDSRIVPGNDAELDIQTPSDTPTSPSSYATSPSSSLDLSDLPPSYDSLVSKPIPSSCVVLEPESEVTDVDEVEASETQSTPPPPYEISLQQLQGQDDNETDSGVSKNEGNLGGVPGKKESNPKKIQFVQEIPTTSALASGQNVMPLTPPPSVAGKREATFPAKRVRKKPCVEEPLPDIAEHPSLSNLEKHRLPHVVLAIDDEDMKIQKNETPKNKKVNTGVEMSVLGSDEKEKKNKSVFFYVEEEELEKHRRRKSSTMNEKLKKKYENEEKECFRRSLENLMRDSPRTDIVKKESASLNTTNIHKEEIEKKHEGHINMGFIGDEGEPATLPVHQPMPKPPPLASTQQPTYESTRRQSDPECLLAVKGQEDRLFRSHSVGNDLGGLNDGQTSLATPTLRKRSLSKGPPDFSTNVTITDDEKNGVEKPKTISFTTFPREGTNKSENGHTGSTEGSPSLLRRLISSPLLLLSRSESTKKLAPTPSVEDGLSRTPSITWENGNKSPRFTGRYPHSPPTITSSCSDYGRHTPRNYILHQHLYRNSRRNVQQKLHRQLSDPHYDHHQPLHHHHPHLYMHHHKKHDPHVTRNATHHDCHSDCPMNSLPGTSSHHNHSPNHHRPHHNNHNNHHHRSLSQRNMMRPKHHETLRRMNTYGHEMYQKYVKDHEHRCGEQEQQEQGGMALREGGNARKLSHYRQEEKGSTDVERNATVVFGESEVNPWNLSVVFGSSDYHLINRLTPSVHFECGVWWTSLVFKLETLLIKGVTPPFIVTRKRPIILPSKLIDPQELPIKKEKPLSMAPKTPDGSGPTITLDNNMGEDNGETEAPLLSPTSPVSTPTLLTPTWPTPNLPPSPMARPPARRNTDQLATFDWEAVGGRGGAGTRRGRGRRGGGTAVGPLAKPHPGGKKMIRWVGVHGGGNNGEGDGEQNGVCASPTSPTTPHIIVSTEDDDTAEVTNTHEEADPLTTTSNGQVCASSQPPPTLPPISTTVSTEKPPPDKTMNMNSTESPESRHLGLDFTSYRKTRRNSMNELYRRMSGSQTNLVPPPLPGQNNLRQSSRTSSRNSLTPSVLDWRQEGNDSLIACVSALYGKLLVVMGMAFPVAEVISHDIPISFYNGFYLYLYIGSIIFLVYAYIFLLQTINLPTTHIKSKFQTLKRIASRDSRVGSCYDAEQEIDRCSVNTLSIKRNKYTLTEGTNHGSMYLKMGAVLFGIGSMIYSGLEVGQYFELQADDSCADILLVISPAARMLFTFIQMYFIFLNTRVAISRHRIIARFGLMHMIGTNLCIWLNVLVQETKHEIINLRFGHGSHDGSTVSAATSGHIIKANDHLMESAVLGHNDNTSHAVESTHAHDAVNHTDHSSDHHPIHDLHTASNETHDITRRSAGHEQAFSIYECSRSELMGELVDNASPFLFPCTIEYSLLCAGVLYVIWNNINKPVVTYDGDSDISTYVARKARHHYSVDCAHANRGLFMGILILVLTIISLILFFVLINNENYKSLAIIEANIIELSVYGVATVTVVIGMIQMRELEFVPEGDIELDNILLLIAQTGVYIYTSFTVIGGHFTMSDQEFMVLPLMSAIITLTQTTLQTIFILDATRRCCYNHDQLERKPGREMVTFLLVCNLAMWAINTFETSRADAHPTQLNFYGIWAWTIISHISMPLAIFYRFHVTVCLCEIWKRSYKLKNEY
ncbi:hypothetical protein Pmani_016929 [Petrolisthes manimaculis]|uniref:Otopetrin-2 n=1 Tax=Petrolisthes manimaculis TaxID=1843537 RepID=A0AAE1PQI4_9EUCA|nr:hypothetical protein Pmani_016929 [Petrolisthes manimaculis]